MIKTKNECMIEWKLKPEYHWIKGYKLIKKIIVYKTKFNFSNGLTIWDKILFQKKKVYYGK